MRQPQASSWSSGMDATGMNTSVESTMPNMMPLIVQLV